jgi:hypothetical protein
MSEIATPQPNVEHEKTTIENLIDEKHKSDNSHNAVAKKTVENDSQKLSMENMKSSETKVKKRNIAYFNSCYNELTSLIDSKITLKNFVKKTTQCMKIVQTYHKLNGFEKKELVIDVLQKLIKDGDNDENLENALVEMLEHVGHPMIDAIIVASKGKFFSTVRLKLKKLFKCCGC